MNMITALHGHEPEWCDVVMRRMPRMFRRGEVNGTDDYMFVYASTFFSVKEEVRRGASHEAIRHQRSQILRYIDGTDGTDYDKEQFAGPFARAVDDALAGRSPCVLQPAEAASSPLNLSLDGIDLTYQSD